MTINATNITMRVGAGGVLEHVVAQTPDWATLLYKTQTGTTDTSFNPKTDITYLGAFRVPYSSNAAGNSRSVGTIAYRPPEVGGRNGANGSIFFGGEYIMQEISVPTLQSQTTDHTALNTGTILQDWVNIFDKTTGSPAGSDLTGIQGWIKFIGDKLHCSWYAGYSTVGNTTNYSIIDDPTDLANTVVYGKMNMSGADRVVKYCAEIPAAHQSLFNNNTHFAGICTNLNIVDRTSYGHSFYGFDPGSVANTDTTVSSDQYAYYPNTNPVANFSATTSEMTTYYEGVIGQSLSTYVATPLASRSLSSFDGLDLPSQSIRNHVAGFSTKCGCAFIPPGTDTICYIGSNEGMRYGSGYKDYWMEEGPAGSFASGYRPWSIYDFDNVFWTMNVNDVAGATNSYDPEYIEFGLFEQDPWLDGYTKGRLLVQAGDFDPTTGKLYLLQLGAPYTQYEDQFIISVYQVGAA